MVTLTPIPKAHPRDYLLSLARGERPLTGPSRSDFGQWESAVQTVERAARKSGYNAAAVQLVLDALALQDTELAALLAPPRPTIEEIAAEEEEEPLCPPLLEPARLPPELSRGAWPSLDIYEAYSREASPEGYDDFHPFVGVWMFSVANARRSYLQLKRTRFYGNVMFALCADTSMFAKSTTAHVAKDVLQRAGLGYLLGPDRTTPQKLLSDMAGCYLPANFDELSEEKKTRTLRRL